MTAAPISEIDVLVLAGGLATRLSSVLDGRPKILALVGHRTFLDYLLEWLAGQGVRRVILGLGYGAGQVTAHLDSSANPLLELVPVIEPEPLGTAGAVSFARPWMRSDPVMVMNGDTFIDADLSAFLRSHLAAGALASVLCARVDTSDRYGSLEIDSEDRIASFQEKEPPAAGPAWINAGVYLFNQPLLDRIAEVKTGSLERDVLAPLEPRSMHAFRASGGFLDIGTPESLRQAVAVVETRTTGMANSHDH